MVVTTSNLVYYLIDRGLVAADSVVDGDYMVAETSRRNRNFKIIRRRHPSYFVKQIETWDPHAIATLQCEARCYWLAQNLAAFAPLSPFLPKYYAFDQSRNILIVELLQQGEDLTEYHRRLARFPAEAARRVAEALAVCHRIAPAREEAGNSGFPRKVPWILTADQLTADTFAAMSRAHSQVMAIVRQYPEFQQSLQALRSPWSFDSFIHGDVKWDNFVVEPANGDGELRLKIVDWELADWGDPCWDVGAIFQAYLSFWIFSMPAGADAEPSELVTRAQYPLEAMQPAIREFWRTYLEESRMEARSVQELLERSVMCGAARMIQTAYEAMSYSTGISASIVCLLQLSLNVLTQPQEAIHDLLGL